MMMILVGAMAEDLFEEKVYKDAVWFVKECGAKSLTLCLKVSIYQKNRNFKFKASSDC